MVETIEIKAEGTKPFYQPVVESPTPLLCMRCGRAMGHTMVIRVKDGLGTVYNIHEECLPTSDAAVVPMKGQCYGCGFVEYVNSESGNPKVQDWARNDLKRRHKKASPDCLQNIIIYA